MNIPFLRESSRFTHHGKRCEVLNIFRSDNEIRYREVRDENGEYSFTSKLINLSDFQRLVENEEIQFESSKPKKLERYLSASQIAKIEYRELYVARAIKESPSAPTRPVGVDEAIKVVSEKTNDEHPPCRSTVQGWIKRYRDSGGNKLALLDSYFSTKTRKRYLPEVEEAFQECIADYYLRRAPFSVEKIHQLFSQKCEMIKVERAGEPEYDFKIPSLSTLRNRIKAFTDEEALVAKYGSTKAKQKIREKLKKFRVSTILERCEMDGLHIHLGIVDENNTSEFLGTIVLMYVMDVYSRVILGYSIHLAKKKSETADLILACLKHTFSIDRDQRWPVVNKMPLLVTDASAPATGDLCQQFFLANNISLLITTVGTPQEKPFIESLNNTLRRMFLRYLPGYLGREKFRGREIKLGDHIAKQASLTLNDFIQEFEYFIHEIYHKNPHSGLYDRAPIDVWNEEFNKQPLSFRNQVRMPVANEINGWPTERKFIKAEDGFYVDKRWYRDAALQKWLVCANNGRSGYSESEVFVNVRILYSQIDVRSITVIHPKTGEPRVVSLSGLENLDVPEGKPIQREEYFKLVERGVSRLPIADKKYYEPSYGIEKKAQEIEKSRQDALSAKKKLQSENRKRTSEHHLIGSEEYDSAVKDVYKDKIPDNVVINENSESSSQAVSCDDDWYDEVDIDSVGKWGEDQ